MVVELLLYLHDTWMPSQTCDFDQKLKICLSVTHTGWVIIRGRQCHDLRDFCEKSIPDIGTECASNVTPITIASLSELCCWDQKPTAFTYDASVT